MITKKEREQISKKIKANIETDEEWYTAWLYDLETEDNNGTIGAICYRVSKMAGVWDRDLTKKECIDFLRKKLNDLLEQR